MLGALSVALSWLSGNNGAMAIVASYIFLILIYSLGSKYITLLDVFLLSSGFLLRVLLGCALMDVPPSNPLLMCSYAVALFAALAKRRSDIIKGLDETHRPSLLGYNEAFLDQAMSIMAAMAVVGYALYSMEAAVLIPSRKFASLPFVMFGVLDYLRLAHVKKMGASPVDLVLSSPGLLFAGVGWLLSVLWSVKLP